MKKIIKILLSITIVLGLVNFKVNNTYALTSLEQITMIKDRLKEYYLSLDTIDDGAKVETCYVTKANEYLMMIQEDGSFKDVDYSATTGAANGAAWSPYLALDRMQAIAIAYHKEGNQLYHNQDVIIKLNKALNYWNNFKCPDESLSKGGPGPRSKNWWENEVGVQLRFSRIGLFMEGLIDEKSMNIILDKLIEKTPVKHGSGQNNLWFDQNHVYYALLKNDVNKLKDMVDNYLNYCLDKQLDNNTKEAIQVDNSFYMHGRQFYSNGYGMSMFRDMSFWIFMLRETQFAISDRVVSMMADYMLDGTSWTIRGDIMELYLGYRPYKFDVGYKNYAYEYIEPLRRMMIADKTNASRYQMVLNNIENNTYNGKSGNNYMWRSTYASHMRHGYGVNIKMDSKDVIGGEWRGSWKGKDNGQLIYWTSSATSTITVDGDEYTKIYPVFDWSHCPGATTPARIVKDYSNWGRFTNGNNHTIGVTNGLYGNTAYDMDKKGTHAKKGYFFFDDEFVALGSGISSSEAVEIHTTLDQSKSSNPVVNGVNIPMNTLNKEYTTKYIHNGKIGYVFFEDTKVNISNNNQKDAPSLWGQKQKDEASDVFKAYINHGLNPKNSSYAYVVVPNITQKEVEMYANKIPVTILSNNSDIQAVRHDGLKQTQINFYKAGSIEYKPGVKVSVDYPCSIIIDEASGKRLITLATNDQSANQEVNVVINDQGKELTTTFITKGHPYAGESSTVEEGTNQRFEASSVNNDNLPQYILDGNTNTYWESKTSNNESITYKLPTRKYLKNIEIEWGKNYASDFVIYTSENGKDYNLLSEIKNATSSKQLIEVNRLCESIKIELKKGNGSTFQIKEIINNGGELLSLNKPVEVSSISSQAPSFTGNLVVDGKLDTRWASLRGEDDNWITIDLTKDALIDTLEIQWEAACSDNYQIEVSSDNKTWKTVKHSLKSNNNLSDMVIFEQPVQARYVKVHSLKSRLKKYGINVYEISIYGEYYKAPAQNIALNKPVEVSSLSTQAPTYIGGLAVDGKLDTRWASLRNKDDNWLMIDLGVKSEIEQLKIYWEAACSDNYQIEISNDNKTWKTVKSNLVSNKNGKHPVDEIVFENSLTARYIKIHSLKSRSLRYGISIYEIEVLGRYLEEPLVNIALNKPSQSSSNYIDYKNNNKVYESKLAFDGNQGKIDGFDSRWVSNRNTYNEWIYVDLEDYYSIDKIVLNWEGKGAKEYKIQISDDAQHWKDLTSVVDGNGGIDSYDYNNKQSGRFVRMLGIQPGSKYGFSLWEFEVYGKKAVDENVALNKKSYATSEYIDKKDGNKQYYSYLAFDGLTGKINGKASRWVSNRNTLNESIYVDLNEYYTINKIVLNWEGKGAKEYKIQISNDGVNWVDLTHVNDGNGGIDTFNYNDKVARYIKMLGIKPGSKYGFSLWEFEVYGRLTYLSKDNLQQAFDKYNNLDKELYTPSSYSELLKALEEAKVILDNVDASNNSIIQSQKNLEKAYEQLVLRANKQQLKELIDRINNLDKELYTPISIESLNKTLDDATVVYNDNDAAQKQVDETLVELQNKFDLLVMKADRSELNDLLYKAENIDIKLYTPQSLELFKKQINEIKASLPDDNATKEDIQLIVNRILDSYKLLVERANTKELQDILNEIKDIDKTLYTSESIEKLNTIVSIANKILNDNNVTQKAIDDMLVNVKNALDSLVKNKQIFAVLEGYNTVVYKNKNQGYSLSIHHIYDKDIKIYIDGQYVSNNDYKLATDTTLITFNKEFIDRLSLGEHTVRVVFSDGEANAIFSVQEYINVSTNDISKITELVGMIGISIVSIYLLKRKREQNIC